MKTFQEFIFEKYYEPDEKLPSGETPVEKATQKSRKRARTIGSQSPENQDRWSKQYDLTRTKVKHGADNPSLNTKVGHREKDEIEIDHDDKYMFLKHKPSGVSFDVEKSDESQYDDVRTIQWNHSQDKVKLSPKEKFRLARTAQKVWDTHVSPRLPNKSIVHNTPSSSYDNRGQPKPINRRSEIYKKAGFGSVDSDGDQFAEVGRQKSPKQIAKGKTRLKPLDPRRAKVEVEWGKKPDEYEEWEDQVNLSNFVYIKEGKTFSEFLEEAKRIKVLRTAHYTSASNKENILKSGFRDSRTGTYHPDDNKRTVYTTPSSIVGNDYGNRRVSLSIVNPKTKSTLSPNQYRDRVKELAKNNEGENLMNKAKKISPIVQSRDSIESGTKIVRVPDAHRHGAGKVRGSYIMVDKDVANKSIDENPPPTIRAKDKAKRSNTQPKRK